MTEKRIAIVGDPTLHLAEIEAALLDNDITSIVLDFGETEVEMPDKFMPNTFTINRGYDFDAMIERHHTRKSANQARPQPDYLKHDPTKRHRR